MLTDSQRAMLQVPITDATDLSRFFDHVAPWQKVQWGTERVLRLLAMLGHPERGRQYIIVGGTNAKGSTTLYLAALLREMGLRVGATLSPHISDLRERIQLNGALIEQPRLIAIINRLRETMLEWPDDVEDLPTYHELWTVAAVVAFDEIDAQWGVVEVGMGGRYDAARAVDAQVAVLGPISFDHMQFLGNTLTAIAGEKVEIIAPGGLVVSSAQDPEAEAVIAAKVAAVGATWLHADGLWHLIPAATALAPWFRYEADGWLLARLCPGLRGRFQAANAALALRTIQGMVGRGLLPHLPTESQAQHALASVTQALHPSRFEVLCADPPIWLEGGHNPAALEAFIDEFNAIRTAGPLHLLVGFKEGKDLTGALAQLARLHPSTLIATQSLQMGPSPATTVVDAAMAAGIEQVESVPSLEAAAQRWADRIVREPESTGLAIGSLYLGGDLRALILEGKICGPAWLPCD